MKVIKLHWVLLAYLLLLILAASLVAAVFEPWYLVLSGASLAGYFALSILKLRCPSCGAFVNLDRLVRARFRDVHCPACQHEITVVTKIS